MTNFKLATMNVINDVMMLGRIALIQSWKEWQDGSKKGDVGLTSFVITKSQARHTLTP